MTHSSVSSVSPVSTPRASLHLHPAVCPPPTRSGSSGSASTQSSAAASTGALPGVPQTHSTLSHLCRPRRLARDAGRQQTEGVTAKADTADGVQVLQPYDMQQAFTRFQVVQTVAGMVQSVVQGFGDMTKDVCGHAANTPFSS